MDDVVLSRYVPIMRMISVEDAMRYIHEAVDGASVRELQSLEIAVLGKVRVELDIQPMSSNDPATYAVMSKRNVKEPWAASKVGGAGSLHPEDIDDTDADTARLTELIDSIHDFGNAVPPADHEGRRVEFNNQEVRAKMHASIGAKIPLELSGDERNIDKILARLADITFVIDTLTTAKTLTFEGRPPLPNPWRGRCIEKFVDNQGPGRMKTSGNDLVRCVDIYFKDARRHKAQIAVVTELAKLRRSMEEFFTTKTSFGLLRDMEIDVMVDQCMTPRYSDDRSCMLFSWITGFSVMIKALNLYFDMQGQDDDIAGDEITKTGLSTLKQHFCDASLYDGGVIGGAEFKHSATGRVFRKDGQVQIEFCEPVSSNGYAYKVSTADPLKNPIPWTPAKEDTIVVEGGFITNRSFAPADHSARAATGHIKHLQSKGASYGWAVPAALKRAGDWGQIEHCKRNKLIFVTADRLTALYAAYRDVPVLLVKQAPRLVDGHAQLSFAMCGSAGARAACCSRKAKAPFAPPRTWAMLGGGVVQYGVPILLGAVVTACAVASSIVVYA